MRRGSNTLDPLMCLFIIRYNIFQRIICSQWTYFQPRIRLSSINKPIISSWLLPVHLWRACRDYLISFEVIIPNIILIWIWLAKSALVRFISLLRVYILWLLSWWLEVWSRSRVPLFLLLACLWLWRLHIVPSTALFICFHHCFEHFKNAIGVIALGEVVDSCLKKIKSFFKVVMANHLIYSVPILISILQIIASFEL